jgi:hypothetical protein
MGFITESARAPSIDTFREVVPPETTLGSRMFLTQVVFSCD